MTLPGSGTRRIETIEGLRWLKRGAGRRDVATYLIQIVDEPHQILALKVRHAFLVLLPIKYVAELIVKVR